MIDSPFWMGKALLGEESMLCRCAGRVNHSSAAKMVQRCLQSLHLST
jgi:hypothetical protein